MMTGELIAGYQGHSPPPWAGQSGWRNYLFLFIIWPFLALLFALGNFAARESRAVIYAFIIYYGITFVIGNEGMDSAVYAMKLVETAALPITDFFKVVVGLYATDTSVDVVQPLITFLVSRFTTDHRYLFAVFAAIFGFFYLRSIEKGYAAYDRHRNPNALIHLIFLAILVPVFAINGFRMWTAAWVFFFGAYHVIVGRNPVYLLVAFSSSFVHFSFLAASMVLLIYYLAGNRKIVYGLLLVVSFVRPGMLGSGFQYYSSLLGGAIQARYTGYASEDYISGIEESGEQLSWFMQIGNDLIFYYLFIAVLVLWFLSPREERTGEKKSMFCFLLLFLSFVNFGSFIPTFGRRFQLVFNLFATLYLVIHHSARADRKVSLLTWAGLFPMALYSAIILRQGSLTFSAWLLSPGLGAPWLVPDFNLYRILFG